MNDPKEKFGGWRFCVAEGFQVFNGTERIANGKIGKELSSQLGTKAHK